MYIRVDLNYAGANVPVYDLSMVTGAVLCEVVHKTVRTY